MNIWRNNTKVVRRVSASSLTLGLVLLVAGVIADFQNFWSAYPFTSNMASATVGALIGLPVALIGIQYLLGRQQEFSERQSVHRLNVRAIGEFATCRKRFFDPLEDGRMASELVQSATDLRDCALELGPLVRKATVGREPTDYKLFDSEPGRELFRDLSGHLTRLEEARSRIVKYYGPEWHDVAWADLCSKWEFLDSYLKPRVFQTGGSWIDPETYSQACSYLTRDRYPMTRTDDLIRKVAETIQKLRKVLTDPDGAMYYDLDSSGSSLSLMMSSIELMTDDPIRILGNMQTIEAVSLGVESQLGSDY